jgi:ornithine carbamoyltransferase
VSLRPLPLDLHGRHLLRSSDLAPAEAEAILDAADALRGDRTPRLAGRTLGLVFMQPSTRTRLSFSAAMAQLGGTPISLRADELQLSRGESVGDTARVLSRYIDVVAIRTLSHADLEAWAEAATVPVINALTELEHPCQALADALTIRNRLGTLEGVRVGWVGDGTNVLVSLAWLGQLLRFETVAACPAGYEPPAGTPVEVVSDPREAAAGADVLVTDIWVSLGQEAEADRRRRDLEPFRLDASLLALAAPGAFVLHCLPAHPGEEIAPDVLYGPRSAVWDEAENRLHVQKALLTNLVQPA